MALCQGDFERRLRIGSEAFRGTPGKKTRARGQKQESFAEKTDVRKVFSAFGFFEEEEVLEV